MTNLFKVINGIEYPLTEDELNQFHNQVAQYDAVKYKDQRKSEYPNFEDYLDAIVKNDDIQLKAYIDACLAVKAKYPKPE